jgi:hypothetical protein
MKVILNSDPLIQGKIKFSFSFSSFNVHNLAYKPVISKHCRAQQNKGHKKFTRAAIKKK